MRSCVYAGCLGDLLFMEGDKTLQFTGFCCGDEKISDLGYEFLGGKLFVHLSVLRLQRTEVLLSSTAAEQQM